MTLMWFDSLDDVRGFMGEDYEAAHVPVRARTVSGFTGTQEAAPLLGWRRRLMRLLGRRRSTRPGRAKRLTSIILAL
jgi:hypothetical protein